MNEDANRADVPTDRFTALWRRLKDHRIAQWTVGYVAVAYGIQHAITLTSEALDWPHAVTRISILLLALGLPVAMTLAWYHGERASRRATAGEMALISVMLLGISFAFYLFVRPTEQIASRATPVAQSTAASGTAVKTAGISLAVLPFINLSSDKEQEFFSDGMTEEITAALAKIPKLPVVGRTSAFQFKGQNRDLRAIGRALNATYLLEGSVRKAGNRVRITAQLIRASDDLHVWTDSYDRDLKDIFAVQEDVARAIAASLQVPLALKQGESLVSDRAIDPDAYQDFLRARALLRARAVDQAVSLLETLVKHNPDFAPGWALLARSYDLKSSYNLASRYRGSIAEQRLTFEESLQKQEMAAGEAIRLDPEFVGGYSALAQVKAVEGKPSEAEELFQKALALDSSDPENLETYSQELLRYGRIKAGMKLQTELLALEPFVPIYNVVIATFLRLNGQIDAAIALLAAINTNEPTVKYIRNLELARSYAAAGRYSTAADTLLAIPVDQNRASRASIEAAAGFLRRLPAASANTDALPAFRDEMEFVYEYSSVPERVLDYPEYVQQIRSVSRLTLSLWEPRSAPARKTERFKALVRKAGLVDYWRARGWPDLCHPTTGDDFECS